MTPAVLSTGVTRLAGSWPGAALPVGRLLDGHPATVGGAAAAEAPILAATGHAGALAEADGIAVAIDGSVYNAEDLPAAETLAEAVLSAYRRDGLAATLARLNGDFALAVFDRRAGALHLVRDRFGVRPLYWARLAGGGVAFASRAQALATAIGAAVRPDYLAVFAAGHYRFFDNDPAAAAFAEVAQVPAGELVTLTRDGHARRTRWYTPGGDAPRAESLEALAEEYRALFRDAVGRRLVGGSRRAFTLSGGLDSSSVLVTAADLTGQRQSAFSTVYGGGDYDETAEIRDVIEAGHADWTPVRLEAPDLFALLERLLPAHDQPPSTVTWLTHYQLCRAVRDAGYDRLFGGLGGDEQHAGEYDYFFYFFADLLAAGEHERYGREVAAWAHHHDHPVWCKTPAVAEAKRLALTDPAVPGRMTPDLGLLDGYAHLLTPEARAALAAFRPVYDHWSASYLNSHTLNEIYRTTMPCCLRAADRNSAVFGLREVYPFFDHRLVDLALAVPPTEKIRDGVTKQLLRRAMAGTLPEATRSRIKKTGWNAPAHHWFSSGSRQPLMDLVESRWFAELGLYDPPAVARLIDDHFAAVTGDQPRDNHMMALWQLVALCVWLQGREDRTTAAA